VRRFILELKLLCEITTEARGKVTDLATSEILPGQKSVCLTTSLTLWEPLIQMIKETIIFLLNAEKTYNVRAEKEAYTTKEESVTIADEDGKTKLDIALEKRECKVTIGDDLGKCFGIKIYI
jgi:hypothetical protein